MRNDSSHGSSGAEWLPPERDSWSRDGGAGVSTGEPRQSVDADTHAGVGPFPGYRKPKRRLWLNVALFVATIASTSYMVSPLYSACLMSILTAHEFGHYFTARYHRVPATLPYFLPAPLIFGTMGAFIRMSPLIPNRKALFDIAAAGPLAGAALAVPISFFGMMMSQRVIVEEDMPGLMLGDPLIFQFFERILYGPPAEGTVVLLHDAGFAGWVGLFVTALNLIPIGQLDGGHISYAVFGRRSLRVALLSFAALTAICVLKQPGYIVFLILLLCMGLRHGPTLDDRVSLDRTRRILAVLLLAVFVVCFTPVPIRWDS